MKIKYIGDCDVGRFQLYVYECPCGFHLGIDASYLEAVDDVVVPCPNCKEEFNTMEVEE